MGFVEEKVRFIDSCDRCGMRLREFYRKVTHEHTAAWISEHHELPDCIRYLAEKIERLENAQ